MSLSDGGSHGSTQRLESLSVGGSHGSVHRLPDESLGDTQGSAHRLRFGAVGVEVTNAGVSAENIGVGGAFPVGITDWVGRGRGEGSGGSLLESLQIQHMDVVEAIVGGALLRW